MEPRWAPPPNYAVPAQPEFRSAALRADLATAFLLMLVVLNLLDMIDGAIDLPAYSGGLGALGENTGLLWTGARNMLVAVSWLLAAFPGSAVFVSMWVHRAYANLRSLGHPQRMSPAMAVGWFYIPIANLWQPLQVMREIFGGTMNRLDMRLLAAWWSLWLTGSLVGSVQFVMSIRETSDPSTHVLPIAFGMVSDVLFIAAAWLLIRIIRTVTRAQDSTGATSWK